MAVLATAVVLPAAGWAVVAGAASAGGAAPAATGRVPSPRYAVAASRDRLTGRPGSPVAHDNEVMALAAQDGRLFAATDQWEYPGTSPHGQILVKDAAGGPWRIFERTASTRVQALAAFRIPAGQGLGKGHSLLVTQAVVGGRSEIQWLVDGATSFSPADAYVLPSTGAAVRSFGAYRTGGAWAVYAGVTPTGVLRGRWSKARHTLVFSPVPELSAPPPASPGLKTQKVTGFTTCAGSLYVSINTGLYRRNDGRLPAGTPRWSLVYREPPVGAFNSGLRGLSCATDDGRPALLFSTEGNGDVYHLGPLPEGPSAGGRALPAPVLELSPAAAIGRMLAREGTAVPSSGPGSISYVIAAYNDFETVRLGGAPRQLFGLEWNYAGGCPATRTCAPSGFDASACFAVRTSRGTSVTYALRCLAGPRFTPAARQPSPVRDGQAFVSIRTIVPSPFGDGRIYYGGYDCDFHPADGAAWVGSSTRAALHLSEVRS